jgi:hypothetical protein
MPNVSLTAGVIPGTGLPPELATRQMQLQVQQQIAEALLAQGMGNVPSTTAGPSGNPYARDTVNIGGILNKYIDTQAGREGLSRIGPQQAAIAAASEAMRKQDMAGVMQDIMGGPTPGPYEGGSIDKKPDIVAAIRRALLSSHPAVQAQGDELQKALIAAQMKGLATPEIASAASRNITAESLAGSLTPQTGGYPLGNTFDLNKWVMKGIPVEGPAGARGVQYPAAGVPVTPAGVLQPPKQPIALAGSPGVSPSTAAIIDGATAPGGAAPPSATVAPTPATPPPASSAVPANPSTADATWEATGVPKVLDTPANKMVTDVAKGKIDELEKGKAASQAFVENQPKLTAMLSLIPNADLRWGGEQITQIRQALISAGFSTDEANKVKDTQTLMKLALPQAAEAARAFNSRATQLEFQKFSDAAAANQNISPGAAKNIIMQAILDGVNANKQHEINISQYGELPVIGKEQAGVHRVTNFPSIDEILQGIDKASPGSTVHVIQDPRTGVLRNAELGGKTSAARSEVQWVYKNGKLVRNAPTSP